MGLTMFDHKTLFKQREEPTVLRRPDGSPIELRGCGNLPLLHALESLLSSHNAEGGEAYVLAEWYSPGPFSSAGGELLGYGLYRQSEAKHFLGLSDKECWGYPRFGGAHYDLDWVQDMIKEITDQDTPPQTSD